MNSTDMTSFEIHEQKERRLAFRKCNYWATFDRDTITQYSNSNSNKVILLAIVTKNVRRLMCDSFKLVRR